MVPFCYVVGYVGLNGRSLGIKITAGVVKEKVRVGKPLASLGYMLSLAGAVYQTWPGRVHRAS